MPTHTPIDLTQSSKIRLANIANSILNQIQYDVVGERSQIIETVLQNDDVSGTVPNGYVVISHDRVGTGLPPFTQEPDPAIDERQLRYHRMSIQDLAATALDPDPVPEVFPLDASIVTDLMDKDEVIEGINDYLDQNFGPMDFNSPVQEEDESHTISFKSTHPLYYGKITYAKNGGF